jgi:DNA-binding XRE family transcriptional regulator
LERKRRGIKADELGRIVGRDRQSISLWENGHVEPSADAMLKLIQHGFVTVPSSEDAA